jgi:hypothetical protein
MIGSTFKGLLTGLVAGLGQSSIVRSPGILVGLAVELLLSYSP